MRVFLGFLAILAGFLAMYSSCTDGNKPNHINALAATIG
jgi:hypothetical protein